MSQTESRVSRLKMLLAKAASWSLLVAITILSVVPAQFRPTTSAPHLIEHASVFLATGVLFGVSYPGKTRLVPVGLVVFTAAVEMVQIWTPGRHARMSDFIVDAIAVCVGVVLATVGRGIRGAAAPR